MNSSSESSARRASSSSSTRAAPVGTKSSAIAMPSAPASRSSVSTPMSLAAPRSIREIVARPTAERSARSSWERRALARPMMRLTRISSNAGARVRVLACIETSHVPPIWGVTTAPGFLAQLPNGNNCTIRDPIMQLAVALAMGAGCVVAPGRNETMLEDLVRRFGTRVRMVKLSGDEDDDRNE